MSSVLTRSSAKAAKAKIVSSVLTRSSATAAKDKIVSSVLTRSSVMAAKAADLPLGMIVLAISSSYTDMQFFWQYYSTNCGTNYKYTRHLAIIYFCPNSLEIIYTSMHAPVLRR